MEFTKDQKLEIQNGIDSGVDVAVYSNPEYLAVCMREIRLGLEHGVDVSVYADTKFDWFQMEEIRLGLENKLDVSKYADADIPYMVMREIRISLEAGMDFSKYKNYSAGILRQLRLAIQSKIDITPYIKEGYDPDQIDEIRLAKEKFLPIDGLIDKYFRPISIHEIADGLSKGLDVREYADISYGWQQMREIRLGLEHRVDVRQYKNPLYSWQQMAELRMGLECGGDISSYKSFVHTAAEMFKIRKKLGHILPEEQDEEAKKSKAGTVRAAAPGITRNPVPGNDGYYELLLSGLKKTKPEINSDGSVKHGDMGFFVPVKAGTSLLRYHRATKGIDGVRSDGSAVSAPHGKELEPLVGCGFHIAEDGITYEAAMDGRVVYEGAHLYVKPYKIVYSVSGLDDAIDINGDLFVDGDIKMGAKINATGDIIVAGSVENAIVSAGGDIVVAHGVVFGGEGVLQSGGALYAKYLQNANVIVNGDLRTDYITHSDVEAGENVYVLGEKGRITGGIVRAKGNIVTKTLGNPMNMATCVKAGTVSYREKDLLEIKKQQESCLYQLKLLKDQKLKMENDYRPEQRNRMPIFIKIENAIYTKEEEMKYLEKRHSQIMELIKKSRSAVLIVKQEIFEGVEVFLAGQLWHSINAAGLIVSMTGVKINIRPL